MTYVESLVWNWSDDKPVLVIYGMFGNDVCNRYTRFSFTVMICLDHGFINPLTVTNKWIIHHFRLHMMWTNYLGTVQCVTPDGYLVHYVVTLSSLYIRITTKEWNFMLFVFVSLVSVYFMTTEKQRMKCENSEFCCCCQVGNIRNVCWWGRQPRDYWRVRGSLRDGTFLQLHHHLVIEISVGHEALQITSNIKQEVLSRTCKAFFTIA